VLCPAKLTSANRESLAPQDLPTLSVALDLVRESGRWLPFSKGSQLPAVAQCLDIAGGICDRSRIRSIPIDRFGSDRARRATSARAAQGHSRCQRSCRSRAETRRWLTNAAHQGKGADHGALPSAALSRSRSSVNCRADASRSRPTRSTPCVSGRASRSTRPSRCRRHALRLCPAFRGYRACLAPALAARGGRLGHALGSLPCHVISPVPESPT
jgi:hypothetical protein